MSDEAPRLPEAPMMPGNRGGLLRRGNPGGGGGRTPNIIREGLRKNLLRTARRMEQRVTAIAELIELRKARYVKALEGKGEDLVLAADYSERALADQERLLAAEKMLADFLAKYGIGMTFTETNADGTDVPRPVIYLPANGRVVHANGNDN